MIEMEMSTAVVNVETKSDLFDLFRKVESVDEKITTNHVEATNCVEKEKVLITSPVNDDFLTIVPKPTLLSKEKAKKRLLAFGLSKFSNFQNNKKQAVTKNELKNKNKSVEDGTNNDEPTTVKKATKKPTHLDVARETVEAIEKFKQEEEILLMGAKQGSRRLDKLRLGNRKRRYNEIRDKRRQNRVEPRGMVKRDNRKRSPSVEYRAKKKSPTTEINSSYSRDHSCKSNDRRGSSINSGVKEKSKEKKSWSDYEDDFCDHPEHNDLHSGPVDVRKMLSFNADCHNISPLRYKKVDGTIGTVPALYVRYTEKSQPRIVYNPNPNHQPRLFFQRSDIFSIISKSQKDCILNLISQAEQAKPLPSYKPPTTRTWYSKNYLTSCHEDHDAIYYATLDIDDNGRKTHTFEKSKKKSDNEEFEKRRKDKKKKSSKRSHEESRLSNDVEIKQESNCKRTDFNKSDTNISMDNVHLHNSISHRNDDPEVKINCRHKCNTSSPSGTDSSLLVDPKTPPIHSSPISNKCKGRKTSSDSKEHNHEQTIEKRIHRNSEELNLTNDSGKHNSFKHRLDFNHKDYKSYSKKTSLPPVTVSNLAQTKIYKIGNDSIETANISYELSDIEMKPNHMDQQLMKVVEHNVKPIVHENNENVVEMNEIRPIKETPIEKLKTKPSELYSPTLQSLSISDNEENEMLDTDEYKSHWESEEELSLSLLNSSKSLNNSWESDDEYPLIEERVIEKPKEITERSLEMPLNINISRPRAQMIRPAEPQEAKLLLFEDLDGTNSWDIDTKPTSFELKPDVNSCSGSFKTNLEDEYMQFMSSVFTPDDTNDSRHRAYSTSSSASTSSTSSSSSDSSTGSSIDGESSKRNKLNLRMNSDFPLRHNDIDMKVTEQDSPLCKVDSTSSPALAYEESKMYVPKPIASIVIPKKSPLLGCNLFKDDSTDNEGSTYSQSKEDKFQRRLHFDTNNLDCSNRQSPSKKRRERSLSPPNKNYTSNRDRFWDSSHTDRRRNGTPIRDQSPRNKAFTRRSLSPKLSPRRNSNLRRGDESPSLSRRPNSKGSLSPRRQSSPKRSSNQKTRSPVRLPKRTLSPRGSSPRRTSSPKMHENSPKRRDNDRRRRDGASPRRRSPKLNVKDNRSRSISPKHDSRHRSPKPRDRSPRSIDLNRHRDDRDKNRDNDISRYNRDQKYRDGSPRYRDSPSRFSPSRRRSPNRHRFSPKRDRSPRYRERSPWRRSISPQRRMYSRSRSKDRKHESIAQALHRLAGMEYDPPKSPTRINSPMDGYIRGVPDSTISDEQLMQNRLGDFNSTQSPVYFNQQPFKPDGSPKRIPLDDRINQVLGIDTPKETENINYNNEQHYYSHMYYDQYNNIPSNEHISYEHRQYKQYNRHLIDVNKITNNKVLQIGNVLQVVPTEQQLASAEKKDEPTNTMQMQLPPDSSQKFVHVGNMLQIVPTTELPIVEDAQPETKESEDIVIPKVSERQLEREKRRQERDRRRKEKEMKKKERELQKQMKLKLKSEEMIKKALMVDVNDDPEIEIEEKPPIMEPMTTKTTKGILVIHNKNSVPERDPSSPKQKKGVKFADGVLPGEGTSPSAGEELSSPPPYKEKRYTKTKKPKKKQLKKKVKVKLVRKAKKKEAEEEEEDDEEDDDNLPPPSPPPGSPPPHIFPPRLRPFNEYYPNYQFTTNCPGTVPGMQYTSIPPPMSSTQQPPQMPIIQTIHPLPLLLQPSTRVLKQSSNAKENCI